MDPISTSPESQLKIPHKHFFNKKFATTLAVILALGAVVLGGFWWWQQMEIAWNDESLLDVPGVIDQASGWETYTNTQYGFELKYPANWQMDDTGTDTDSNYRNFAILPEGKTHEDYFPVSIFIIKNTSEKEYLDRERMINRNISLIETRENSYLGGLSAPHHVFQRTWKDSGNEYGYILHDTLVAKDNLLYVVQWTNNLSAQNHKDKALYDKIISTFKFTDTAGQFCGGIAGVVCPSGYSCKMEGSYPDAGGTCEKEGQICAQVITRAKNQQTGEIKDFPTPCDVPAGWQKI